MIILYHHQFIFLLFFLFNSFYITFGFHKKEHEPLLEEIPYIECEVCQKTIAHTWERINNLRKAKGDKLHEFEMNDIIEDICDPETIEGEWITKLDLSINKKDRQIYVISHEEYGHCKRECQTIVHACKKHMDEIGLDVGEALWKRKPDTKEKLVVYVCKKWTKACPEKRGENRLLLSENYDRIDEIFKVKTDKDREMDQMLKKMKDAGLGNGAQMYSREDIENMNLDQMQQQYLDE